MKNHSKKWCFYLVIICGSYLVNLGTASAQNTENEALDDIITPDLERRTITEDQLDTEDWEIGIYGGILSIEDFGSNGVYGARLSYHMTEDFFIEANYGTAEAGETTLESENIRVIGDDRNYTYYNVSLGYNILPGEIFLGRKTAFNTAFYIVAGVGNTTFNNSDYFTIAFGGGLRFYATDSVAFHATVKDHIFERDFISKQTNNLETTLGFSLYF